MFGAWTNLTDLKAGNTSVAGDRKRSTVVKHCGCRLDFRMGANGAHDWDEGWEYFCEATRRFADSSRSASP